ncbi:unnamed protein product [Effrenium voratum]|nr:unnamed protein product [Effrenium voratum]
MPRNEKFDNVVPLGSACFIARHLQQKGLRTCKYPFDWMYSTPYLVRHALSDKFKTFLDITQYQRSSSKGLEKAGTIHKVYQHMQCTQGKKVVFPHHQLFRGSPKARRHRLSYQRAVARLHAVLKGKSGTGPKKTASTLFVLAVAVQTKAKLQAVRDDTLPSKRKADGSGKRALRPQAGGPELCSRAEVLQLFQCLERLASGPFHLDVVYLLTPPLTKQSRPSFRRILHKKRKGKSLRIVEMSCKGANTGLFFREDADMVAFHKWLTDFGRRRFGVTGTSARGYDEPSAGAAGRGLRGAEAVPALQKRQDHRGVPRLGRLARRLAVRHQAGLCHSRLTQGKGCA